MKSIYYWYAGLAVLLGLNACSQNPQNTENPPSATETTQTQDVQAASAASATSENMNLPVLLVASDLSYPPYVYFDGKDNVIGLEAEVLRAVAKKMGYRLEFKAYTWNDMFHDLKARNISLVAGGFAADEADMTQVDLTSTYIHTPDCIATLKDTPPQDWSKGKVAHIPDEGLGADLQKQFHIPEDKLSRVDTAYLGLSSVVKKTAQSFVSDCIAIRYYANSDTFKQYAFNINELPNSNSAESADVVFGIRKDLAPELLPKFNQALKDLNDSGELEKIKQKWRQY